ncbi:hypothetical protein TNCV_1763421 [Trichonephila clavipes]|nr:hypothetical protein TNCV_1763421 [Trichonephila clavipes]
MSSLEQRANIKLCVLLEQSPYETLEMLKKAYRNNSSIRRFLPISMAEKEIEGTSFFVDSNKHQNNIYFHQLVSMLHPSITRLPGSLPPPFGTFTTVDCVQLDWVSSKLASRQLCVTSR